MVDQAARLAQAEYDLRIAKEDVQRLQACPSFFSFAERFQSSVSICLLRSVCCSFQLSQMLRLNCDSCAAVLLEEI